MTPASPGQPLLYPLAGLLRERPGAIRLYPVAGVWVDVGPELALAEPIDGTIRISRTNRGVFVQGRLDTALATQCSRCLRDVVISLALEIEEEALPGIDIETGQPLHWPGEDDIARLNNAHELDMVPVVREAIQLAEPIAPLCREDCPGLCPVCGLDLTDSPHQHEEELDPRLEALLGFAVDGDGGSH